MFSDISWWQLLIYSLTFIIIINMVLNTIKSIFRKPVVDNQIKVPQSLTSVISTIEEMDLEDDDRVRLTSEAIANYGQSFEKYYEKVIEVENIRNSSSVHERLDVIENS